MKILRLFSLLLAITFISLSCEKAEKAEKYPVQTAKTEVATAQDSSAVEHDPNYFQGTKRFCEFLKAWEYEVTIKGNDVSIKLFPGSDNEFHPDKSKVQDTHKGKIVDGKIVVDLPEDCDYCGPELAESMFKYADGVFSVLHMENDYNDFQECKGSSPWPMPDNESINVPVSDQQWRFCSRSGGDDYIITFVNGFRETGMLYFEVVTPTDRNMNNVTRVFTADYKAGDEITVKKPVNCTDCGADYMKNKFKFNENSMELIVTDENGNPAIFDECMLSQ